MSTPAIQLNNVSFGYGDAPVLDHISCTIERGDYVGVLGPNGGGKTTLIKLILGLIKPTRGTIEIFGTSIEHLKQKSRVGYVPQRASQAQFPATVYETVQSGRIASVGLFRRFSNADNEAVDKAIAVTGIEKLANRLLHDLSGGERQRVLIARALAGDPKILILDEPVVGVDAASQEKFYHFLDQLNRELGITILFVSHDIEVITGEAKSVLCLNHKLICHTTPPQFMKGHYLEEMYGTKMHYLHHHDHEEKV